MRPLNPHVADVVQAFAEDQVRDAELNSKSRGG